MIGQLCTLHVLSGRCPSSLCQETCQSSLPAPLLVTFVLLWWSTWQDSLRAERFILTPSQGVPAVAVARALQEQC